MEDTSKPQFDEWEAVEESQFEPPYINIYGDVQWNKEWDLEKCRRYIDDHRQAAFTAMNLAADDPNNEIACMEYSLDPKGKTKPDYLGYKKRLYPDSEYPDTYPDGTPTWADKDDPRIPEFNQEQGFTRAAMKFYTWIQKGWNLTDAELAAMLKLSIQEVRELQNSRFLINDTTHPETSDRMACVLQIRRVLFCMFRNPEIETKWIRRKIHDTNTAGDLSGRTPMEIMVSGNLEDMVYLKNFTEHYAGLR